MCLLQKVWWASYPITGSIPLPDLSNFLPLLDNNYNPLYPNTHTKKAKIFPGGRLKKYLNFKKNQTNKFYLCGSF